MYPPPLFPQENEQGEGISLQCAQLPQELLQDPQLLPPWRGRVGLMVKPM